MKYCQLQSNYCLEEPRLEMIHEEHDRSPTVGEPNTGNDSKLEETPRFCRETSSHAP